MGQPFHDALDITIRFVEGLKERGVRYVPVSPETLAGLGRSPTRATPPPPRPTMPSAPVQPMLPATQPILTSMPSAPPPALPAPTGSREGALDALRARVLPCTRCPNLAASRKNVVFGVGNPNATLMFVGEAPGADEDAQGEPFVGRAGQLLTKIIETMGQSRQTVYIANILKCRPDTPGQTSGNRKPTGDEMQTCLPYLLEQIRIIRPKVIVALGVTSLEGLFGRTMPIMRVRGTWLEFEGCPVMPTYHPAYLLRNQSITEKRKVWEDMLQVMERLGLPITEKQRGFFLSKT